MEINRQQLERLADIYGILPSMLRIGECGDTSAKFMKSGVDIGDDGYGMKYTESGAEEFRIKDN